MMDGGILGPCIARVRVRTPQMTGGTLTNRFVVLHISRGNREVPLAITNCGERGNAIGVVFRVINTAACGLDRGSRNRFVASFIKPLNGPAGLSNLGGIYVVNNNINYTVTLPITRTLFSTNYRISTVVNFEGESLLVLRSRFGGIDGALAIAASSNSCNVGNGIAVPLERTLRDNGGCSRIVAINPLVVVGFIITVAGPCGVPAAISVGPVVVSNANVYNNYHLAINNRAGFTYISKPSFSNFLVSFSRTVGHNADCHSFRHRTCDSDYGLFGGRMGW